MAASNFSGNQYRVGLGIRDHSVQALGSGTTDVDAVTEMKLTTVNDIAWGGAFQTATVVKSSQTPSIHTWVTELVLLPDPLDNVVDLFLAFVNSS